MILLEEVSFDLVVACWLRVELSSPRFRPRVVKALRHLRIPPRVIERPNLTSPRENFLRQKTLKLYRGDIWAVHDHLRRISQASGHQLSDLDPALARHRPPVSSGARDRRGTPLRQGKGPVGSRGSSGDHKRARDPRSAEGGRHPAASTDLDGTAEGEDLDDPGRQ